MSMVLILLGLSLLSNWGCFRRRQGGVAVTHIANFQPSAPRGVKVFVASSRVKYHKLWFLLVCPSLLNWGCYRRRQGSDSHCKLPAKCTVRCQSVHFWMKYHKLLHHKAALGSLESIQRQICDLKCAMHIGVCSMSMNRHKLSKLWIDFQTWNYKKKSNLCAMFVINFIGNI